jgi:hypothetical protein
MIMNFEESKECRICAFPLSEPFLDLGKTPLANSYLHPQKDVQEESFPLKVYFCEKCHLVQLGDFEDASRIFKEDYAYFSSYSSSWLEHAWQYVEKMTDFLKLETSSQVIEIASNDGYLLQYFLKKNIPALGIEPCLGVARAALEKRIATLIKFFGVETANELVSEGFKADLLLGNNVLAHVPHLHDFVEGMKIVLKPEGVITMEFPHLVKLIENNQFDTIYHEHFSYFTLNVVSYLFAQHGLMVFDVEELTTHGGSLRIFAQHQESKRFSITERLLKLKKEELEKGFCKAERYELFAQKVKETRKRVIEFVSSARKDRKKIAGYGAPAKGNTLLNYCGLTNEDISFTVDISPHKQGLLLPGSRIPIHSPEQIDTTKPDYLLILPWNLRTEIESQMRHIRGWGAKFVVPIPEVMVW